MRSADRSDCEDMKDAEHQNGETLAFPVSDLTRRLLRRASEPIGVIDTRHAEKLHSRSSLLPAQRLEFLNNLKTRYGVEHGGGNAALNAYPAGGMPLTSPVQKPGAASSFELGSAPPWGSRTAPSEAVTASNSEVPSTVQYRVKRPGTHSGSGLAKPFSTEVAKESPAAISIQGGNNVAATQVRRKTEPTGTAKPLSTEVAKESPAAISIQGGNNVPTTQFQRKTEAIQSLGSATADSSAPPSLNFGDVSQYEGPRSSPVSQVSELPPADVAPQMHLRRKPRSLAAGAPSLLHEDLPGGQRSVRSGTLAQVSELPRAAMVAPMPLQRMPEPGSPAVDVFAAPSPQQDLSNRHVFTPSDASSRSLYSPSKAEPLTATGSISATATAASRQVFTPSDASSSSLYSQGKAEPLTATGFKSATSAFPRAATNTRAAVSAEISVPPSTPGSRNIVWRKAETNTSGQGHAVPQGALLAAPSYTSGPQIMRQLGAESNTGGSTEILSPTSGNGGVDLMRVAEQVSRIMARQLRIERERRGRTR